MYNFFYFFGMHYSYSDNLSDVEGVQVNKFPTVFGDERGQYLELFNLSIDKSYNFKQISVVHNVPNIIRGMHGDWGTSKKVGILTGNIRQVLLDCRVNSKTYGLCASTDLISSDNLLISIPSGVANGFQVYNQATSYFYLQDTFYGDFNQFTVSPFDKSVKEAFDFSSNPFISERDKDLTKTFNEVKR